MTITFVDSDNNRKTSYDGVTRIETFDKDVYISGFDFVSNQHFLSC